MIPSQGFWDWQLLASSVILGGAIAFSGSPTKAQIVPDTTLGAESSVVIPQSPDSAVDVIQGGATRGANLFHSFEQFSVTTGGTAYFSNALDIQNIISRVTGSSISNIDGLIRANGTANLFLLNPNGIIFGPNASLNIGGSFAGSTASSLNFADGNQFSATVLQTTPLLTMSVPVGLQYGGTAGSIRNQSRATNSSGELVGLQVQPSKNLVLVGGNVSLDGGILQAPGGRVELGGVAGAGTVGLNVDGNNLHLSFPDDVLPSDVSLTNGAGVNVPAANGGSIAINARNFDASGGSILRAGIGSGLEAFDSQAGDIEIDTTETVTVAGSSILNTVQSGAVGNSGNVSIATRTLLVTSNAQLNASTFGQGNSGSVTINARDAVSFDRQGAALSTAERGAVGKGGDIWIITRSLSLTNGAKISVSSEGSATAGNIKVTAHFIRLDNQATLSSDTTAGHGDIFLRSQNLVLLGGSNITTNTTDTAIGGTINLDAAGVIAVLENSNITANNLGGWVNISAQIFFPLDDDTSRGLVTLPAELVDASGLIAQTCPAGGGQGQSEFIVTGRSGLPENPSDTLSSDAIEVDLVTLNSKVETAKSPISTNPTTLAPTHIVEAQGWVINNKGEVVLTATAPNVAPHIPWLTPATCQTPQKTS